MEIYVPDSAESVTQTWLKDVLTLHIPGEFEVTKHDAKGLTKGKMRDGYLSQMVAITAEVTTSDGKTLTFHLMAKMFPAGEFQRKMVTLTRAFDREIHVYKELLRQVREAQAGNAKVLEPAFAKCYHTCANFSQSAIVMEDLKATGYRMHDRYAGLDFEHCQLIVKELGRFHALTYYTKVKQGNIEMFLCKNAPLLVEPLQNFGPILAMGMNNITLLLEGQERKDLSEKIKAYLAKHPDPSETFYAITGPRGPMSTFVHGDCWNNNMMFRYETKEGKEVPVEVKPVDLQISRYTHPTNDLAYLFYTSTNRDMRDKHLESLLKFYHNSFLETMQTLGMECPDAYSYDEMKKEFFKVSAEAGFLCACWLIPAMLMQEEDAVDLDTLKESDMKNLMDDYQEKIVKGTNKKIVDRIVGLAEEMIELGVI
ncbi:unnamed protein product [Darwinula stevensoni]|uniref:CHK kinase-like domain-containing protein n=1 Tax=Darwinula stevensoni TaxID=69355 RepID=A0A7R9A9F4_9CRUS|nr:unnamed protein product [Darwinula stevensoni]CAG0897302.1 unnamed protein product [Darwinula stevensoni]